MRNLIVIVCLSFASAVSAQWVVAPSPSSQYMRSIKFATAKIGWLTGNNGYVFKTTDAGITWQSQSAPSGNALTQISVVDSNIVYISSFGGKVLKTINGGLTWTTLNTQSVQNLNSIWFVNKDTGFVAGYSGALLRTTDGGMNWLNCQVSVNETFTALYFTDALHGYVCGTNTNLYITTNGGNTWINKSFGSSNWLFGLYFATPETGFVVGGFTGSSQVIYKTTDAGLSWVKKNSASINFLTAISMEPGGRLWSCGTKGEIVYSDDIGETWKRGTTGKTLQYEAVTFLPDGKGFVCGDAGSVLTYQANFSLVTPRDGDFLFLNTPTTIRWAKNNSGALNLRIELSRDSGITWEVLFASVSASLNSVEWIPAGNASKKCKLRITDINNPAITVTSNGLFSLQQPLKVTWNLKNIGVKSNIRSVKFASKFKGFLCTDDGKIFRTLNAGVSWQKVHSEETTPISQLVIVDSQTVYASTYSGTVLFSGNGGSSWTTKSIGSVSPIYSLSFPVKSIGYAVTSDGKILKTQDAGNSWSVSVTLPTTIRPLSVNFRDSLRGIVTCTKSNLYYTSDGGLRWSILNFGETDWIFDSEFLTDSIIVAVGGLTGTTQSIYTSTNGGVSFVRKVTNSTKHLLNIWKDRSGALFACGTAGELLYSSDFGSEWISSPSSVTSDLNEVAGFGDSLYYCVGANGTVLVDGFKSFVSINKPSFDDRILASSAINIEYSKVLVRAARFEYSLNNGRQWSIIADSVLPDRGIVQWQIPNVNSDSCLLRMSDCSAGGVTFVTNGFIKIYRLPGAAWVPVQSGTTQQLRHIVFTTPKEGYICGDNGIVLKTERSGTVWKQIDVGTTNTLTSIYPFDSLHIFMAGFNGTIIKSQTGGLSWSKSFTGVTENINAIYFPSKAVGYAVGYNGLILKTTDFGDTWFRLSNTSNKVIISVFFTDDLKGFISGESGLLQMTTDGGLTWSPRSLGTTDWLFAFSFASQSTGFAVGGITASSQGIYKTTDGGVVWNKKTGLSQNHLLSIARNDNGIIFASGAKGEVIYSFNDGESWQKQTSGVSTDLNAIAFRTSEDIYAVGVGGKIIANLADVQTSGKENEKQKFQFYLSENFPNPFNPVSRVNYSLPHTGMFSFEIFDITGRLICVLDKGEKQEGEHSKVIDMAKFSSGVYLYRITLDGKSLTRKMLLIK